jgi:hypothetical protein
MAVPFYQLPIIEFESVVTDSPEFRDGLVKHENALNAHSQWIKV